MGASLNTELQVFNGGLHLRPAPHLITQMEAIQLSNVNVRTGTLRPYRLPKFIETAPEPYFYWYNSTINYYPSWRDNVMWNNTWYWTGILGSGKMLSDGTVKELGIPRPTAKLEVASASPVNSDGLVGDLMYVYTYYEASTGAESPPSDPSDTIEVDREAVTLSGFQELEGYTIRIYRLGGAFTAFTAVDTIAGDSTTFLDDLKYSSVEGTILNTTKAFPPPPGLRFLTESNGRFYGAVGTKLYYTPIGKPDSWFLLDYINFSENITMLASVKTGLIIASKTTTWVLSGTTPETFTKFILSHNIGCVAFESLAVIDGAAFWLDARGIIMSNGTSVTNMSETKLGLFMQVQPRCAIIVDRVYFLVFGGNLTPSEDLVPGPLGGPDEDDTVGDLVPGSVLGEVGFAGGAMLVDMSFPSPVFLNIEDPSMTYLDFIDGMLYQISTKAVEDKNLVTENGVSALVMENGYFSISAEGPAENELLQMFASDQLSKIKYTSPLLTENSIGLLKQYEKVRITFSGAIVVTILNDKNELMQRETLGSVERTSKWLGIPVERNRAYGIRISIEGIGFVDSIMYTWTPREAQ